MRQIALGQIICLDPRQMCHNYSQVCLMNFARSKPGTYREQGCLSAVDTRHGHEEIFGCALISIPST